LAVQFAAALMENAIAHVQEEDLPAIENRSLIYHTPWLFLSVALVGGFGFWLLCQRTVADQYQLIRTLPDRLRRRLSEETASRVARGVFALGFLLVWSVVLFSAWRVRVGVGAGADYPPHFWSLLLGAFTGGLVVWLLT